LSTPSLSRRTARSPTRIIVAGRETGLPPFEEGGPPVRGKREVRYVVSRLEDPDDPKSRRHRIGCYPYLDIAKKEADRVGPGSSVDAEGGSYSSDGMHTRHIQWQAEWINLNIYQGREKRRRAPDIHD
jgi:hypothetical protein